MKEFVALMALAVAAPAQESEEQRSYAAVAAEAVNAIYAGQDLRELTILPELSQAELAELEKLAGCKPSMNPRVTKNFVAFDWRCDVASKGETRPSRTTTMRFQDDGKMFALAVNPSTKDFAPTPVALAASDLPRKMAIAEAFGEAVRDGEDPTLGGLIPLTELQHVQLKEGADRYVKVYDDVRGHPYVVWKVERRPGDGDLGAELHFDQEGRPVGVIVEDSLIRTVEFTTTRPVF